MNMNFNFINPTKLYFGRGSMDKLSSLPMPGKKALVLISNGKSTRKNGYLDRTLQQLNIAGADSVIFDKIMENPIREVIMEGASFAKENNCDFIVALGGGAVIDASAAISAMATNDGDLWDYVSVGTGKGKSLKNKGIPIIAIATTSGTGSELNGYGVFSNLETKEKVGFGDPGLTPVFTIVDPELMRTIPPKYTAYQGFDALFHNTEALMSKNSNVLNEAIALSAIENIAKYLPRAVKDGNDIEAREHVAYGSTMAGFTMHLSSTIAQHSMEHAMSAHHHNLPHGAGLILISKAFAEFFIEKHACDEQFIKMAKAMGVENACKAEDFVKGLVKLQEDCGVADLKMSDFGFLPGESMELAKSARSMEDGHFDACPCQLTDEDCAKIFEKSYR
ncbi:MAG: iron-containing alcohol dehydrogenase [Firmicutes bacterium]|jgi:alcohol dehydrogenase|nr:iron-containing alcohol dehydrogenase [Bacillota bacterium]